MLCCKGDGSDKRQRVFGADVALMLPEDLHGNFVPKVLKETAAFVRAHGMTTQGIFRRSANQAKLKEVKLLYNSGELVDFDSFGGVHMAANVMKTFLRDLRVPLMGFSIYPIVMKFSSEGNLKDRIVACQTLLKTYLKDRNLVILRCLVNFLLEVTAQSASNGMTGSNVAIVFGPNLFWAKGAGPTSGKVPTVDEMNKVSEFTQFLFDNSVELFAGMMVEGYIDKTL